MLQLNELAFQNADLIVLLGEDAAGWSATDLARRLDRDRSNVRKSLLKLHELGFVTSPTSPELTEAGQEQRAAIQRARHGGDKRKPRGRWPVDRIVRNPANRMPRDADVAALADTIESAEDVLQDVLLTPPDANGVRMLLAGEHRWRAVLLLAEQDRLPAALAEGLPFRERQASAADQILIRIVENTARADLSPLEDARQLLALQRETNWSAREIAKKTGRSPADSDTGVRDVQVKIKVAKEAAPEAIAEYERTGSWDALRDSVARRVEKASPSDRATTEDADQPKPRPSPEQELRQALAESGPAMLGAVERPQQAAEDRIAKVRNTDQITHAREQGWEPEPSEHKPEGVAFRDATVTFDFCLGHDPVPIVRLHRQTLPDGSVGWGWNVAQLPGRTSPEAARGPREFLPNGDLARNRAIAELRRLHREALPVEAVQWLDRQMGPHYVDGVDCYNASNAGERRRALGWEARKANSGSGTGPKEAKPRAAAAPDVEVELPSDDLDVWGRDHNTIVADEATLRRVEDFTLGHTGVATPGYAHQLLNVLGLEGPFGADDQGNVVSDVVGGLQPRPFATIDVDAEGPPQRARAIALLVAWAFNRTFNEERRS